MIGFENKEKKLTFTEALAEAKRCLHCKIPLCQKACPAGNHIPDFIQQVKLGNLGEAQRILNETTNLPAICGRVCPHEKQCQGGCVLGKKDEPVQIGKLEAFVADFNNNNGLIDPTVPEPTRGKVAVIGSGPAGMTVAGDLARMGFEVTVYEGEKEAGGILRYGIPSFRLDKNLVDTEMKKVKALGVKTVMNCLVGTNGVTIDSLFAEGYDAIFIGSGTQIALSLPGVQGIELNGVCQATELLHAHALFSEGEVTRDKVPVKAGERVAVVGGGNVAMDAARTALRLGADVTVVYRRTDDVMPAIRAEYEEAVKEGVKFVWKTNFTEFMGDKDGNLVLARMKGPEEEHVEKWDKVFLAISSVPAGRIVGSTEGINVDEKGYVVTGERPQGMTTRAGVFAAGDVVHRPQTVVLAMKAAKEAAKGIAQYVDAKRLMKEIGK